MLWLAIGLAIFGQAVNSLTGNYPAAQVLGVLALLGLALAERWGRD